MPGARPRTACWGAVVGVRKLGGPWVRRLPQGRCTWRWLVLEAPCGRAMGDHPQELRDHQDLGGSGPMKPLIWGAVLAALALGVVGVQAMLTPHATLTLTATVSSSGTVVTVPGGVVIPPGDELIIADLTSGETITVCSSTPCSAYVSAGGTDQIAAELLGALSQVVVEQGPPVNLAGIGPH